MFTFKKIKTFVSLVLICCSGTYLIKAMEQPTPEKSEEASSLANLPPEDKAYITSFLGSAKDLQEVVKSIKALSITSKKFHDLINDSRVLGSLAREISKRFNISPIDVALAFKNPGALEWLKDYIQQHPQEKELINQRLIKASEESNKSLLEFLLNAGADVNHVGKDGAIALNWAASKGDKDMLELLLKAGADVNPVSEHGKTPLYAAAYRGHKDIVERLLKAGANVNTQDADGQSPFYRAIQGKGDKEIVDLLLKAGADVNHVDKYIQTPLYLAARKGDKDIVALLLNAGAKASINQADNSGYTPLSLAVQKNNKDIVELLLAAGADVNTQDAAGRTPLSLAVQKGYKDIENLLREHGAAQ
jgi:ankyrin repeat protein